MLVVSIFWQNFYEIIIMRMCSHNNNKSSPIKGTNGWNASQIYISLLSDLFLSLQYWYLNIQHAIKPLPHGVMVCKLVFLDQLRLSSEFEPQWLLHNFGLVPHLNYSWETNIQPAISHSYLQLSFLKCPLWYQKTLSRFLISLYHIIKCSTSQDHVRVTSLYGMSFEMQVSSMWCEYDQANIVITYISLFIYIYIAHSQY